LGGAEHRVAYLAWAPLGTEPVRRFAQSYREQPGSLEHTLVVIYNGFVGERDARLAECRREFDGIAHEELLLGEPLLDLAAYVEATRRVPGARWCFLNSYSVLLAPGWLALLSAALDPSDVGLVGASGSWGSMRSYVRFQFGLGGPYAEVFDDRRETNATLAAIDRRNTPAGPRIGFTARRLRTVRATFEQTRGFARFPASHVRSTGFVIDADTLASLRIPPLRSKIATYRFESGAASLTAQVTAIGMRALVVDRAGRAFAPADWPSSATFWQSRQEGLLIADKQTSHYDQSDLLGRSVLAGFAWGGAREARAG